MVFKRHYTIFDEIEIDLAEQTEVKEDYRKTEDDVIDTD